MPHYGFRMSLRSQRISDVVTAVCVPVTLVMYLHLMMMPPITQQPPLADYSEILPSGQMTKSPNELASSPSQYTQAHISVQVSPPLNITGNGREDLLLMTPLLRCGSTTIRNLLKLLQKDNGFTLVSNPPKKMEVIHIPEKKGQKEIVDNLSLIESPSAVLQSFSYINFTEFNRSKPIHISLVRDPVERAISWFYHVRAPFQLVERHIKFPDTKFPTRAFLKKDLETCLKDPRDAECRYVVGREKLGHTLEFFCGHEEFCPIFGVPEGLRRAKEVVEKEFAVVGILEEWDKTLAVLEHYIPRYFKGATERYYKSMHGIKIQVNENFYKPKVEERAGEFIRKNFTLESEFYDFLKQRLNRQYKAIATTIST